MRHLKHEVRGALKELDPLGGRARANISEREIEEALRNLKCSSAWSEACESTSLVDRSQGERPLPLLRRSGRRGQFAGVSLALLTATLLALVALFPRQGQVGHGVLDEAMASAASAAAQHASSVDSGGEIRYLRMIAASRDIAVSGGMAWATTEPRLIERWFSLDGGGRERVVSLGRVFATPEDQSAWARAGSPSFGKIGGGYRAYERRINLGQRGDEIGMPISDLPSDAGQLRDTVLQLAEKEGSSIPASASAMSIIGGILRDPEAASSQRRAAYLAMAAMPDIEFLGQRRDPVGRLGEAVGVLSGYSGALTEWALIYDPRTGEPLAFTERQLETSSGLNVAVPAVIEVEVYLDQGASSTFRTLPPGVSRYGRAKIRKLLSNVLVPPAGDN